MIKCTSVLENKKKDSTELDWMVTLSRIKLWTYRVPLTSWILNRSPNYFLPYSNLKNSSIASVPHKAFWSQYYAVIGVIIETSSAEHGSDAYALCTRVELRSRFANRVPSFKSYALKRSQSFCDRPSEVLFRFRFRFRF